MTIADKARRIPGVVAAEAALNGALASEQDLPINDYDKQTAQAIATKLEGVSPGRAMTSRASAKSPLAWQGATRRPPARCAPTRSPTRTVPASSTPQYATHSANRRHRSTSCVADASALDARESGGTALCSPAPHHRPREIAQESCDGSTWAPESAPVAWARMIASSWAPNRNAVVEM